MEFSLFVNHPENVLPAHISFIRNLLMDNLSLKGIPFKILVKKSRKEKK